MFTKVIHIKDAPRGWETDPEYVYIGRAGHGKTGYWGNPFPLNGNSRGSTLTLFREYAEHRIASDWIYASGVFALNGKTLVCFCKPHACHGDVLAELAER
jgi:hypothetical protein